MVFETTLFFDSKKAIGKDENFTTYFNPPLLLDIKKIYKVALIAAEIWYSWYNITSKNNKFKYFNGKVWKNTIIPPGAYNVVDIQKAIQNIMKENNDYIPANTSGDENLFHVNISPNYNTFKSEIELKNNYKLDFTIDNTFRDILGFNSRIISGNGKHHSDQIVNITSINTIEIHCSLVDGSYINGKSGDLIHCTSPNVPPGSLLQVRPFQKMYNSMKVMSAINSVTFKVTDQDGNLVDLNNERVTYYLHIKEL
ncbi:TPA_asm: penton [Trichoplax MELD virus]|nr:TPA_asm: penton [Trichoplax MELD virus]